MAYEFKNLGTVDVVETVADTANVLIEEDGVIKRAPKEKIGGSDYITIHATNRTVENEEGDLEYYDNVESLSSVDYDIVRNAFDNNLPTSIYVIEEKICEYSDGSVEKKVYKILSHDVGMNEGEDIIWIGGFDYWYGLCQDGTIVID